VKLKILSPVAALALRDFKEDGTAKGRNPWQS
jgi:hypothetical protein